MKLEITELTAYGRASSHDEHPCIIYTKRLNTLLEYCKCLYKLDGCLCGGPLHIFLDDYNDSEDDVLFCLNYCLNNQEDEGSVLGELICKEYLRLSEKQRKMFMNMWKGLSIDECPTCRDTSKCGTCLLVNELFE